MLIIKWKGENIIKIKFKNRTIKTVINSYNNY